MCAEDSVARCWQSPKANFNLTSSNCESSNKTLSLLLLSRRNYENRCCCLRLSSSFASLYLLSLFLFLILIKSQFGYVITFSPCDTTEMTYIDNAIKVKRERRGHAKTTWFTVRERCLGKVEWTRLEVVYAKRHHRQRKGSTALARATALAIELD